MDSNLLGKKILEIRKRKKITQNELALLSGISQSFISDLEKGKKTPTIDTLNKLAKGLDCSIVDLIEIEEKKNPPSAVNI